VPPRIRNTKIQDLTLCGPSALCLRVWHTEARRVWRSPQNIKAGYRTASILRNNRVVFNVKGNTYRLVVSVKYEFQVVYIRFIGTHAEYDKIRAEEL
jgi:mRNA interferase HigB